MSWPPARNSGCGLKNDKLTNVELQEAEQFSPSLGLEYLACIRWYSLVASYAVYMIVWHMLALSKIPPYHKCQVEDASKSTCLPMGRDGDNDTISGCICCLGLSFNSSTSLHSHFQTSEGNWISTKSMRILFHYRLSNFRFHLNETFKFRLENGKKISRNRARPAALQTKHQGSSFSRGSGSRGGIFQ